MIPDVSWILQRVVLSSSLDVDSYDLRLYAMSQATLGGCLLLAGGLALLSTTPRRTFAILALNTLVHLLLDACQTKWGNGIHLLTPLSWQIWNLGLFWPESIFSYGLAAFGLGYFIRDWRRGGGKAIPLRFAPRWRWGGATVLLAAYLSAPMALMSGLEQADNHSVWTLRHTLARPGRHVEFDRIRFDPDPDGPVLTTFAGERISLIGRTPRRPCIVSVRGEFVDQRTIEIDAIHVHLGRFRSLLSWVGLALVLLRWCRPGSSRSRPAS